MRIIQLRDEMLQDVVVGGVDGVIPSLVEVGGHYGFPTPYDTIVVNNEHIFVALNKTDGGLTLGLGSLDIVAANDKVLVVKG